MSDALDNLIESVRQEAEARAQTLQRLVAGADASRVFGPPVTGGEYTVIPAAEIASGGGLGSGMGVGGPGKRKRKAALEQPGGPDMTAEEPASPEQKDMGGGGGGGGGSRGRPVAAIIIGPQGVTVRPVLDITKLVLTGLGAFLAVVALSARMGRKKAG